MKKRFKVVIIDNKTSEVSSEFDTDCIIAGISLDGEECVSASLAHCNTATLARTISSAFHAIKKTIKNDPESGLLAKILMDAETEEESGGDDDV